MLVIRVICLLILASCRAALGDEPALKRELDIRNDLAQPDAKYIVFCSRETSLPTSFGHAFVVWGFEDASKQLCGQESFGYYPTDDVPKSLFRMVPGDVVNEKLRRGAQAGECQLVVRVSEEQYKRTRGVIEEWRKKDFYKLREQDCVSFTGAVADALELPVPDRGTWNTKFPAPFVRDLTNCADAAKILTGIWECVEGGKTRFRLEIAGSKYVWIDNPPEGQQVRVTGQLKEEKSVYLLERPNDKDTLIKLNIQPDVADEVVARKPMPSVLSIAKDNAALKGRWKGIRITKDDKNKLKDITYPERDVTFQRRLPK